MSKYLAINNLTVCYRDNRPSVDRVSLSMDKKEILVIAGESGSGKSTLIRTVMGLLPVGGAVTQGNVLFDDMELARPGFTKTTGLRGNKIAMVFQDARAFLNPKRKIGSQFVECLRSHMRISGREARDMALGALTDMHLPDPGRIMNSYSFELSGGMCQRVALAMAISEYSQPDLLLADEPTSTLDVVMQAQFIRRILSYRERFGTSVILVTHNFGVAAYIADTIAVMKSGRIVECGKRDQVLLDPQHEYTKNLLTAVPKMEV